MRPILVVLALARSEKAKSEFRKSHPCPSAGKTARARPGYGINPRIRKKNMRPHFEMCPAEIRQTRSTGHCGSTPRRGRWSFLAWAIFTVLWICFPISAAAQGLQASAISQIQALIVDKQARSPIEQKVDSNLLYAMRALTLGDAHILSGSTSAAFSGRPVFVDEFIKSEVSADQTIEVSIRAKVSDGLLSAMTGYGAKDVHAFEPYSTISARIPIHVLLSLASREDVQFISPREQATTNQSFVSGGRSGAALKPESEG